MEEEIKRLKELADDLEEFTAALKEAKAEERAAIVKWLRQPSMVFAFDSIKIHDNIIAKIEAGEHIKKKKE